jgi:hypothetical protein
MTHSRVFSEAGAAWMCLILLNARMQLTALPRSASAGFTWALCDLLPPSSRSSLGNVVTQPSQQCHDVGDTDQAFLAELGDGYLATSN